MVSRQILQKAALVYLYPLCFLWKAARSIAEHLRFCGLEDPPAADNSSLLDAWIRSSCFYWQLFLTTQSTANGKWMVENVHLGSKLHENKILWHLKDVFVAFWEKPKRGAPLKLRQLKRFWVSGKHTFYRHLTACFGFIQPTHHINNTIIHLNTRSEPLHSSQYNNKIRCC